jgi:hypothetical protein
MWYRSPVCGDVVRQAASSILTVITESALRYAYCFVLVERPASRADGQATRLCGRGWSTSASKAGHTTVRRARWCPVARSVTAAARCQGPQWVQDDALLEVVRRWAKRDTACGSIRCRGRSAQTDVCTIVGCLGDLDDGGGSGDLADLQQRHANRWLEMGVDVSFRGRVLDVARPRRSRHDQSATGRAFLRGAPQDGEHR